MSKKTDFIKATAMMMALGTVIEQYSLPQEKVATLFTETYKAVLKEEELGEYD